MRVRRSFSVVLAGGLAWLAFGTTQALAAMPWWHLTTVSSPAKEAGGEAQVIVEASNLGDAVANELNSSITVGDVLPAGVAVVKVFGQGDGQSAGEGELQEKASGCSIEEIKGKPPRFKVACSFPKRVGPYEHLILIADVLVKSAGAGRGINEASVSGGFARPASSSRALALEGPPPEFGVQSYEVVPEEEGGRSDTLAGSHPFQLTSTIWLNTEVEWKIVNNKPHVRETVPVALTKDLRLDLPPGLLGNPTAIAKCNVYVFSQEAKGIAGFKCPLDSIVGVATSMVDRVPCCEIHHAPVVIARPVYNLEPAVGEPARFGFATPVKAPVTLDTSVRTGGDYGVSVSVSNITQYAAFLGSEVTIWGSPSDPRHDSQRGIECLDRIANMALPNGGELFCPVTEPEQPFLTLPTWCGGVPTTSVYGDSWSEPQASLPVLKEYVLQNALGEPTPFVGCNNLDFKPSIVVKPDGQRSSAPTGLTVDTHVAQDASLSTIGRAESAVKNITVTLPEGVAVNPAGADGLQACTDVAEPERPYGEIALQSNERVLCPEASKIGAIVARTPLWSEPFQGSVYLASQNANPFGSLIAVYIVVENKNAGVVEKLAGEVKLSETGQLTTTVKVPQLPFEDAELSFFGGSRAPLVTPPLCGSYRTTASFEPWAENGTVEVSSPPFTIVSGPDGSQATCKDPLPFQTELAAGSTNIQAGAFTPFTTTMSRADGNQNLKGVQLRMPQGLSGKLSGVELCPEPLADEGRCGANSLIGETLVSVGLGGNPFTVTGGRVYLTGPYEGAPFGLSIVNPAKAGPFDLGQVVVRAKIEVDLVTAALTVTTDSTGPYRIPAILDGIPLQIRHVKVTIARGGFTFNPTSCAKKKISASLSSTQGATDALSIPFEVTNCATLGFKPSFKASTSGRTSRARGASLHVKLAYPKAPFGSQANIRSVKVELPKQLPSRLSTLNKACGEGVFNQNPAACPRASRVGVATAVTPVIPVPLTGPAYFVSRGATRFPELIIVLQGYGVTVQLHGQTFIRKGITSSTFKTVPDVPVGTFELTLPEGAYSALAANGNLCKAKLKMPTAFTAQNGMTSRLSTQITVTGCVKHKKKAHKTTGRRPGRGGKTKKKG